MTGTDGAGLATEGPLSHGFPHPRILGRYVGEPGLLGPEDAIDRMTCLPARKLRWPDRGLVKRGHKADLVVLNPDRVADRATYEPPHQYPSGIVHMLVDGRLSSETAFTPERAPVEFSGAAEGSWG